MMDRIVTLGFACASLAPGLAPAQVDVAACAPESSYLVVSIPDAGALLDALDRSSLRDLWDDPSVQAWFDETTSEAFGELRDEMDDLGIDVDDLSPPTGQVGLAYFFVDEPGEPEPSLRILASADFGDGADAIVDAMWAVADDWEDEDLAIVLDDEYRGATIVEFEWTGDEDALSPMAGLSMSDRAFFARLDGTILVSDEEGAVERAIDAILGDDVPSIADADLYRRALVQHPEGQHARVVFMMTDHLERFFVSSLMAAFGALGDASEIMPVLRPTGLLDVEAVGVGMTFDGPDAPVEMTHAFLIPEKRGIAALFDAPPAPFTLPELVSPDAAEVTRVSMRFDEIFDVIGDVIATLDEEMRAEIQMAFEMARGQLQPMLEVVGPEMYVITSYDRPLSPTSMSTLVAMPVRDELIVNNTLAIVSSQTGVLAPRDFEGAAIYEVQNVPVSMAIGAGFGHLVIGDSESVEDALRQAANPAGASLADEPRFRDATRFLSGDMMLASWMDMAQRLEWIRWQYENEMEIFEATLDDPGIPPDIRRQILDQRREALEDRPDLPPLEVLTRVLGDVVTEMRSTPDGFRGKALLLEAED